MTLSVSQWVSVLVSVRVFVFVCFVCMCVYVCVTFFVCDTWLFWVRSFQEQIRWLNCIWMCSNTLIQCQEISPGTSSIVHGSEFLATSCLQLNCFVVCMHSFMVQMFLAKNTACVPPIACVPFCRTSRVIRQNICAHACLSQQTKKGISLGTLRRRQQLLSWWQVGKSYMEGHRRLRKVIDFQSSRYRKGFLRKNWCKYKRADTDGCWKALDVRSIGRGKYRGERSSRECVEAYEDQADVQMVSDKCKVRSLSFCFFVSVFLLLFSLPLLSLPLFLSSLSFSPPFHSLLPFFLSPHSFSL